MDVRIIVKTTFENGTTKTRRLGRLSRSFRSCRVALNCEMRNPTKSTAALCP